MGNKIPRSWFDDDPEWEMLRQKAANRPVSRELKQKIAEQRPAGRSKKQSSGTPKVQTGKTVTDKEFVVNLKLSLPTVKLPDVKAFYQNNRKRVLVTAGLVAMTLFVFGGFKLLGRSDSGNVAGTSSDPSEAAQEEAQVAFNPLVPLPNLKDATGKQSAPKFKYDKEKQVLGFVAQYNGVDMTVSQQKAPDDFSSNPARLMSVAESLDANETIETQKGMAYIATNEKTKAQTAIFVTDDVLVFIRTNKDLDEEDWKFYINQLNPRE